MPNNNTIQESTGYWITRLARSMEQDFETRLQALGITRGAYAVLGAIHHDGKTTPAALAQFLGVDGAAVTRHLDRLEGLALIERQPSSRDRRSIDISVTPEGTRVVRRGQADSQATNDKFTAGLTQTEVNDLQSVIRTMLANADQVIPEI